MTNQQVDDALNDYFSDLLGNTADVVNNDHVLTEGRIENKSIDSLLSQEPLDIDKSTNNISAKKCRTLTPIETSDETVGPILETPKSTCEVSAAAKINRRVDTTIEAKVDPLDMRNEEGSTQLTKKKKDVLLTQVSEPKKSSCELDQKAMVDLPVNINKEPSVTLPKSNLLSDSLSPIKAPVQSLPIVGADTEIDSFNDHKERLERMLRQVTSLTADAVGVSSKTVIESKTSLEADVDSNIQASSALAQEQSQAFDISESEVTPLNKLAEDTNIDLLEAPILGSQWNENGRPEWAQERFDILLLEIDGLQLAVPLVSLGQIQEIDEEITPLFGQTGWFMGLQNTPVGNVKVVNTAKFIMPERSKDNHNYKYVISINGLRWGLAVDNIKQPITIDPEAIRWRPKRDSRPWMAGMVKDHMCVLLDIPKVGEILQEQDKNRVD